MPAYAGVQFSVGLEGDGMMAVEPEQESHVTLTHVPGSDEDDVQWGGLGAGVIACTAAFDTYAEYLTIKAARGITKRTLTWLDLSFANMMLLRISKPRTLPERSYIFADLEFHQGV